MRDGFAMKLVWRFSTFAIVLGVLFSLLAFASPLSAADNEPGNPPAERLLVQFKPGTSSSDIAEVDCTPMIGQIGLGESGGVGHYHPE